MPFNIYDWMNELILRLKETFGARLAAVGLQGSFKRGEAHEQSDIDAVVVLDGLTPEDLTVYKCILPPPTRQDALEAAQTGAGTLFHALCHTQVHGEITSSFLAQLYKGTFFVLQAVHFAQTGEYISGRQKLHQTLSGHNKAVLGTLLEGKYPLASAELLFYWCRKTLAYTAAELRAR